jgi:aminopeptidase-like protein
MKENIVAGYCLTCVGDNHGFSMVHTRYGDTLAERVLEAVLRGKDNYKEYSYLQRGSDERQYNAPGIDLPIVTFCRTKFEEYQEYHTSADNLDFITPEGFEGSYEVMTKCIDVLEMNGYYKVRTLGEPQLGKRGLYPTISHKHSMDVVRKMMNIIAYLDGSNDLPDLNQMLNIEMDEIIDIINTLKENGLIGS